MNIYPTKTCFDDAIQYLKYNAAILMDDLVRGRLRVCHGVCLFESGKPYAHAWLEWPNEVMDFGFLDSVKVAYTTDKDEFYESRKILEVTRYSLSDLQAFGNAKDLSGPWKYEYWILCGDTDRKPFPAEWLKLQHLGEAERIRNATLTNV